MPNLSITFIALAIIISIQQILINADTEDDCLYLEYQNVALALDVCFCEREAGELSCTIFQCIDEESSNFQAIHWNGDCFSGEPTANSTVSATAVYGNDTQIHCSSSANTKCAVTIRYYQSNTSSCDKDTDDYQEFSWIKDYCYNIPSQSYSYKHQCDGDWTVYTDEIDCSGDKIDFDFTVDCALDNDDNIYEVNEKVCGCGSCKETQSSATRIGIFNSFDKIFVAIGVVAHLFCVVCCNFKYL